MQSIIYWQKTEFFGNNLNDFLPNEVDFLPEHYWPTGRRWGERAHVSVAWQTCHLSVLYNNLLA